jgi:hypothetical protein
MYCAQLKMSKKSSNAANQRPSPVADDTTAQSSPSEPEGAGDSAEIAAGEVAAPLSTADLDAEPQADFIFVVDTQAESAAGEEISAITPKTSVATVSTADLDAETQAEIAASEESSVLSLSAPAAPLSTADLDAEPQADFIFVV